MNELQQLYQEVILDHNKNPRNFGVLSPCTNHAEGRNPLCGDHLEITINLDSNQINDIKFDGSGCAISKASASIMTTLAKDKSIDEVKSIYDKFHFVVTSKKDVELDLEELGKLAVFAGVREFPARVKCASLAWRTLISALENKDSQVCTE